MTEIPSDWSHRRVALCQRNADIIQDCSLLILNCGRGLESSAHFCARIRETGFTGAILCIGEGTADAHLGEATALDAGADDFITRPLSAARVAAHVRALLRRESGTYVTSLRSGAITLDPTTGTAFVKGLPVHLTPTETRILTMLIRHAGKCVTSMDLATKCTGSTYRDTRKIRVHVAHLAVKLHGAGRVIENVRGVGYRICT